MMNATDARRENTADLRAETQGSITFYHSLSTPGFWFSAGELEALVDNRIILRLPERKEDLSLEEEYDRGPTECQRCEGIRLFEIRSYLSPQVRMRACHVCHGRWIGAMSLETLINRLRYRGVFGVIRRIVSPPRRSRGSQAVEARST